MATRQATTRLAPSADEVEIEASEQGETASTGGSKRTLAAVLAPRRAETGSP
jgi:hypothetical protein